jgi:hypothetical protein
MVTGSHEQGRKRKVRVCHRKSDGDMGCMSRTVKGNER